MILRTLACLLFSLSLQAQDLAEGDIIFQSNISPQCKAIELATHSKYSHCGLIFKDNDAWYVLEAVQPVRVTAFAEWIARDGDRYVVKRLKGADSLLTPAVIGEMKTQGKKYLGRNYDSYFGWSDERIYCSELVWKIYKSVLDLEVGVLKPLRCYDLSHPLVKKTMAERYGARIPMDEKMVSPGNIFDSPLLETVVSR
ncbi:YiiX family permuted papain-like enzyme [Chitinophaga lutea]